MQEVEGINAAFIDNRRMVLFVATEEPPLDEINAALEAHNRSTEGITRDDSLLF